MDCPLCKSKNPDNAKFCCECGLRLDLRTGPLQEFTEAAVRKEVDLALAKYTIEEKTAEFNITEAVTNRLLGWAKIFGSLVGVLIVLAGFLGVKGLLDIERDTKEGIAKEADQIKKDIAAEEEHVKELASKDAEIRAQYTTLESNLPKHEQVAKELERVENEITGKISLLNAKVGDQLDKIQGKVTELAARFQPLPSPKGTPPFHLRLDTVITPQLVTEIEKAGKLVFQITGDTGSPANSDAQRLVAQQMTNDFDRPIPDRPAFLYILGNLVFFNGEASQYYDQFYGPYVHYPGPIFAIPGNHDGDPIENSVPSLDAFMRNFCAVGQSLHRTPEAGGTARTAMVQPYCYWTLETPFATVVGLYTNVPVVGEIDPVQQEWFTQELKSAPGGKALLVCLHHSPYSFDPQHSGSRAMADAIAHAIQASRRVPNMILSSSVFNYQRIERKLNRIALPLMNVGNGGYHRLHKMKVEAGTVDPNNQAQLVAFDDQMHGYLTLTIDKDTISGIITLVDDRGTISQKDKFSYSARALYLEDGEDISF